MIVNRSDRRLLPTAYGLNRYSLLSVTRVGFEPDLAGLKDQQPHQKSNEPIWRLKAIGLRLKVLSLRL